MVKLGSVFKFFHQILNFFLNRYNLFLDGIKKQYFVLLSTYIKLNFKCFGLHEIYMFQEFFTINNRIKTQTLKELMIIHEEIQPLA